MQVNEIIPFVIGGIIGIGILIYLIINQKHKVIEWLKYAVSEAEKILGSGTGQLKLRQVYDWFCAKFRFLAAVLPFRVFSAWVDTALETMREWLDVNNKIGDYIIEGGSQNVHK